MCVCVFFFTKETCKYSFEVLLYYLSLKKKWKKHIKKAGTLEFNFAGDLGSIIYLSTFSFFMWGSCESVKTLNIEPNKLAIQYM